MSHESPPHLLQHPAFRGLERRWLDVPAGFDINALGQLFRISHDDRLSITDGDKDRRVCPNTPWSWLNEEIFEWIALGEAVREARERFVMVELGAGYGRWLVSGALIARHARPDLDLHLVGVEAEPNHVRFMREHFTDNGLDPDRHTLIEAAVSDQPGTVGFVDLDGPTANYGQYVSGAGVGADLGEAARRVRAVGINDLLVQHERIDLIDCDIQGYERSVIPAGVAEMTRRVRRLFVGVHEPLEIGDELQAALVPHGWRCVYDFPVLRTAQTEFGEIEFTDGAQYWVNPWLDPNRPEGQTFEEYMAEVAARAPKPPPRRQAEEVTDIDLSTIPNPTPQQLWRKIHFMEKDRRAAQETWVQTRAEIESHFREMNERWQAMYSNATASWAQEKAEYDRLLATERETNAALRARLGE